MNIIEKIKNMQGFSCTGPVSEDLITDAQKILSVLFSDDYFQYIKECGEASFYGHELTGICNFSQFHVVNVTKEERENNPNVPGNLYVIEQANIDGIVIWQSASGEVYQSMPGHQITKIAGSLCEYIDCCS